MGRWPQLAQVVADNLLALDQKWWLRLATRNDAAASAEEKLRLSSLASTVMTLMDVRQLPYTLQVTCHKCRSRL